MARPKHPGLPPRTDELKHMRGIYKQCPSIENILASFLITRDLRVVEVELMVAQPGGKFINGAGGVWASSKCEWCLGQPGANMTAWALYMEKTRQYFLHAG